VFGMRTTYRLNPDGEYAPRKMKQGEVIPLPDNRYAFRCPCGIRIAIATRAHKPSFDSEGTMTLKHSVGTKGWIQTIQEPFIREGLPLEWCHFIISNGIGTVCDNAKCYGKR